MVLRKLSPLFLSLFVVACSGGGDPAPAPAAPPPPPPKPPEAKPLPVESFSFSITFAGPLPAMTAGQAVEVPVTLRNTSSEAWPGDALTGTERSLNLAYHLYTPEGEKVVWDGARTRVTLMVPAGGEVSLQMRVKAPDAPGRYLVEPDMVQERVGWFSSRMKESPPPRLPLVVKAAP